MNDTPQDWRDSLEAALDASREAGCMTDELAAVLLEPFRVYCLGMGARCADEVEDCRQDYFRLLLEGEAWRQVNPRQGAWTWLTRLSRRATSGRMRHEASHKRRAREAARP
jgi:hypothetical protein